MAYISQDEKKQLAPAIKAVLKKYNMKGTIGIQHHSSLVVRIKSGAISLDDFQRYDPNTGETTYGTERGYLQFTSHIHDTTVKGTLYKFLKELVAAMKGTEWYDRSDSMTDYFDVAYYININIGSWSDPYVCTWEGEMA